MFFKKISLEDAKRDGTRYISYNKYGEWFITWWEDEKWTSDSCISFGGGETPLCFYEIPKIKP